MFKKLTSMKISKRLNFGYMLVIVLMVISGIFSIIGLATLMNTTNNFVNGSNRADTAVKVCRIDVNIAARTVREMAINPDTSKYEEYKAIVEEKVVGINEELAALEATGLIEDTLFQQYKTVLNNWETIGFEIIGMIESGDDAGAVDAILNKCAPALDEVVAISEKLDAETDAMMQESITLSQVTFWICVAVIVIFIVVAVLMARKLRKEIVKSIAEPLAEIEAAAKELTEGNLHSNLEYHSTDEIGSLAHSLRKAIRILGTYVDDIADFMNEFSKGNFTVQPLVEWKGDFIAILDSITAFEHSMADTVGGIHAVAEQVKGGSEQVSASAMDLAQGATDQASITEELAATIETVSEQVSQNAEKAKEVSNNIDEVGREIEVSDQKMQEMVQAMTEINEASQEIGKIIATINDIAAQTNLLALNASIEAARAGEAGKGFAVVADQVSVLAAQSAEAAKESTTLIESSLRVVEKGKKIADETAQHLEEVVVSSKKATEEVTKVAEALEAQNEAFEQINTGVDHINDVVQTNSATSQECAAASEEMNSQAAALENLILQFEVIK